MDHQADRPRGVRGLAPGGVRPEVRRYLEAVQARCQGAPAASLVDDVEATVAGESEGWTAHESESAPGGGSSLTAAQDGGGTAVELVSRPVAAPSPSEPAARPIDGRRSGRLHGLDALRGIAALGVTMFHLTSQYDTTYHFTTLPSWSFPYGGHGVTLFFVISGFVIFMTLERTRRPWDFVVSRFSRLYPTYWAALILATAALLMFPLPGTDTSPARLLGRAAVNVTMFQRWFRVRSVDPVYWTLEVELCFYLIMLALLSGKALKYAIAVFTGLTLLALADQLWGPRVGHAWLALARGVLILEYVPYFLMGMLIYKSWATGRTAYLALAPICLIAPAAPGQRGVPGCLGGARLPGDYAGCKAPGSPRAPIPGHDLVPALPGAFHDRHDPDPSVDRGRGAYRRGLGDGPGLRPGHRRVTDLPARAARDEGDPAGAAREREPEPAATAS